MVNGGLTSQSKENGASAVQQVPVQRKKLLKAPTLAELDSSDSEVSPHGPPCPDSGSGSERPPTGPRVAPAVT